MKFSGKMYFMVIIKVKKKQGFKLSSLKGDFNTGVSVNFCAIFKKNYFVEHL